MDDLASKLGELLKNPAALEQFKGLAGLFGGAASSPQAPGTPQPEPANQPASPPGGAGGPGLQPDQLKGLASLLGGSANQQASPPPVPPEGPGVDADMLQSIAKMMPLLSSIRQEDDGTRLLHALRPLLGPARQKKLDESVKLLQMMRLLPLLKGSGFLGLF
jgi:hypothetical protein